MTDPKTRLAEIRARCEKATPGPWSDFGPCRRCDELHLSGCNRPGATDADLSFLARVVDDVPWLLERIAHLEGLLKQHRFDGLCPWCERILCAVDDEAGGTEHSSDCPAFTPEGEIK